MNRSNRRAMASAIMFAIIIVVGAAVYLPPFEKVVYTKSNTYEYEEIQQDSYGYEGYRGGTSVPVVDASDESQELEIDPEKFFVLKIDAKNLEPLGIYRPASYDASSGEYETSAFKVLFLRMGDSYAQYYLATFANDQKVPVLINDRLVKIQKSGEITLPIGSVSLDSNLSEMSIGNSTGDWYINAVSGIESSYEMKQFRELRMMTAVGLWIVACVGMIIVMLVIQVRRSK